jgi:hypothetical protein
MVDLASDLDDEKEDRGGAGAPTRKFTLMEILMLLCGEIVPFGGAVGRALYLTGFHRPGASFGNPAKDEATNGSMPGRNEHGEALYQPIDTGLAMQ